MTKLYKREKSNLINLRSFYSDVTAFSPFIYLKKQLGDNKMVPQVKHLSHKNEDL